MTLKWFKFIIPIVVLTTTLFARDIPRTDPIDDDLKSLRATRRSGQVGSVSSVPQPLGLEEQIRSLEAQLVNTGSSLLADDVYSRVKQQLASLYAQRPINQLNSHLDQGGDNCASTTIIPGLPYSDTGSTSGRANDFNSVVSCAYSGQSFAPDVIYAFTAQYSGQHTVSLCGSSYDTQLEVRSGGSCPGAVQVACNDDGCGVQSNLVFAAAAGTTYYVIVDGWSGNSGNYVLNITDDCNVGCQNGDAAECAEIPSPTFGATDCDGGCNNSLGWNNPPNLFGSTACGQTVCGSGFTYLSPAGAPNRDTDWYLFTLAQPGTVTATGSAEFPLQLFVLQGSCDAQTILGSATALPCQTATLTTTCLAAGSYYLWAGPSVFSGIPVPRDYRVSLSCESCYPCPIVADVTAPNFVSSNTCYATNNCPLLDSPDQTVHVTISTHDWYTFSLCASNPAWDSYLYLTRSCCDPSQIVAEDNDNCDSVGLSAIRCIELDAGSYFVVIEGATTTDCGAWALNITTCRGACCYGNDNSPSCTEGSPGDCAVLSGSFIEGVSCESSPCIPRPSCSGFPLFSQRPQLPYESLQIYLSDLGSASRTWDNFSGITEPIGTIRFWGGLADSTLAGPCSEDPLPVRISFYTDSLNFPGSPVCTYDVTATATLVYPYGSTSSVNQYDAILDPPCLLTHGWVLIAGQGDPGCWFFWATSAEGDSNAWRIRLGTPRRYRTDYAFCLGGVCRPPEAVVIQSFGASNYQLLSFNILDIGWYQLFETTDPNAVFPAGWSFVAHGTFTPGMWQYYDFSPLDPQRRYLLRRLCDYSPAPVSSSEPNPFQKITPVLPQMHDR